jgi:hypothetical protein
VNVFSTIVQLYARGGIEVSTALSVDGDAPQSGRLFAARTVIQPDADVITYVAPQLLDRPDLWRQHLGKIASQRATIGRFRAALNVPKYLSLPFFLWGCYGLISAVLTGNLALVSETIIVIARGFVPGAILLCLKPLFFLVVRLVVQRELRRWALLTGRPEAS